MSASAGEISSDNFILMASGILLVARGSFERAIRDWGPFQEEAISVDSDPVAYSSVRPIPRVIRKVNLIRNSHNFFNPFGISNAVALARTSFLAARPFSVSDLSRCFLCLYVLTSIHKPFEDISCDLLFQIIRTANDSVFGSVNGKLVPFVQLISSLTRLGRVVDERHSSSDNIFRVLRWDHVQKDEIFYSIKFHRSPLESIMRAIGGHSCAFFSSSGTFTVFGVFHLIKSMLATKITQWNKGWSMSIPDHPEEISDDDPDL